MHIRARRAATPRRRPRPKRRLASGVTRAQLVARLDGICRRGNAAAKPDQDAFKEASAANDYTAAANAIHRVLAHVYDYGDPTKLTAPPADRAAFGRYLASSQEVLGLDQRVETALRAQDTEEVNRLANLIQQQRATRTEAAVALGTEHCGS